MSIGVEDTVYFMRMDRDGHLTVIRNKVNRIEREHVYFKARAFKGDGMPLSMCFKTRKEAIEDMIQKLKEM